METPRFKCPICHEENALMESLYALTLKSNFYPFHCLSCKNDFKISNDDIDLEEYLKMRTYGKTP